MITKKFSEIKKLVLQEILGDRTTSDLSRTLGFSFDKYKRWLEDKKILKWDEFLNLSLMSDLNLTNAMDIIQVTNGDENIFAHLKIRNSFESNQEVADYLNCHISVVKRYIQGETIPDVETIFKMIDFYPNNLAGFLHRLFYGKFKNPILSTWIVGATKDPFFKSSKTIISIIEACLKLERYSARNVTTDKWLSDLLKIEAAEIRYYLNSMLEAGALSLESDDQYVVNSTSTNTDVVGFMNLIPFFQNLNQKAIEMLERKKNDPNCSPKPGLMAMQICPVSKESMVAINSVLVRAHSEIFKILEEEKGVREEVCCLLVQHFTLTNPN